jgi:hypothetical protein
LSGVDERLQKERGHSQRCVVGEQNPVSAQYSLNNSSARWWPRTSKNPACIVVDFGLFDDRMAKRYAETGIQLGPGRSLASHSLSRIEL